MPCLDYLETRYSTCSISSSLYSVTWVIVLLKKSSKILHFTMLGFFVLRTNLMGNKDLPRSCSMKYKLCILYDGSSTLPTNGMHIRKNNFLKHVLNYCRSMRIYKKDE